MVISGGNFKPDTLKPKEVVSLLLDDEEIEMKCNYCSSYTFFLHVRIFSFYIVFIADRQRTEERRQVEEQREREKERERERKRKQIIAVKTNVNILSDKNIN